MTADKQEDFRDKLKDHPDLLLRHQTLKRKLQVGVFFSLMATFASSEVMISSLIGQKAFPNDSSVVSEFLTQALHQKYEHFTNGTIVGIIGLVISLFLLIYLANRLRLLYKFEKALGQTWKKEEISASPKAFYKSYGIDPKVYTLATEAQFCLSNYSIYVLCYPSENEKEKNVPIFCEYLGMSSEEYNKDLRCTEILSSLAQVYCKKKFSDYSVNTENFAIKPIKDCENLVDEWKANSTKSNKALAADSKRNLIISILVASASIEIMISSSIGQKAFPSAPNIFNNSLTHTLHAGHPHFTAGTLIGMIGFILSTLAFIYFAKKLRSLSSPNVGTHNTIKAQQLSDTKSLVTPNPNSES